MNNNVEQKKIENSVILLSEAYKFDAVVFCGCKNSEVFQFSSSTEEYSTKIVDSFPAIFKKASNDLLFYSNITIRNNSKKTDAFAISFRFKENIFEALFFYSKKNFLSNFDRNSFLSEYYMTCFFNVFKTIGFKKIFSSSQNILMIKDNNFKYIYANDKCLEFFNLSLEQILGKDDFQIAIKKDAEEIRKTDKRALENEDVYNCRREIHGKVFSVDKCKILLKDDAPGIWVVARDISEEEEAKNALKIEKKILYTTLKSIDDAVITTDVSGCITMMNRNAQQLTGWDEIDALGKQSDEIFRIIDEDTGFTKMSPVKKVIKTRKATLLTNNTLLISKNGKKYYVSNLSSPIIGDGNNFFGVILVFRDVTKEYTIKKELIDSKKQYQNLFSNMMSGFALHKIITNKKGTPIDYQYVEVNEGFEKHTGLKKEDVIGKNITKVLPSIGRDSFNWIEEYGKVALEGKELRAEQFSSALKKWYKIYAFSPEYGYFATIIEDITSKKMIDVEIEANQTRLESLVKILQYQSENPNTILKHALNEALNITKSKIGYIFSFNKKNNTLVINAWSGEVHKECKVIDQKKVYNLEKTGLWGDVVRFKKSVIDNNFKAPSDRKKGLPYGHVTLSKYLSVPLFSDGEVVAVVGVANKKDDYTKTDELQLRLLMNSIWSVVERKIANQKSRQEEKIKQNLAESLEMSPLGMIYWKYTNEKSEIVNWNASAEKLFEWKAKEIIGRDFIEVLYYPDDGETAHTRINRLKSTKKSYHFKNRCITKSGKLLDIKWFVTYIKSEENEEIYGMSLAENYTEINKYQKDLEFTKNQFEYALEGSQSGIWDWNLVTDELLVNDQWLKLFGYTKKDLPKQYKNSMMSFWRSRFHPGDKEVVAEKTQNQVKGISKFYHCEYRVKHKEGHWIWIADRGYTTEFRNSKATRMTGTVQNISERMIIQKDLEIRNKLADIFIEYTDETLFKETLNYILEVSNSSMGFISYIDEHKNFVIASSTENIWKNDININIKNCFHENKFGLKLIEMMNNKHVFVNNRKSEFYGEFVPLSRMILVPIIYNNDIIGHFLTANANENYTNQEENELRTMSKRISNLLYSRLKSIKSERKREKAEIETQHQKNELKWLIEKQIELIRFITVEDLLEYVTKILSEKIQDSVILLATISKDKKYFIPKVFKINKDGLNVEKRNLFLNIVLNHKYPVSTKKVCNIPNRTICEVFIDDLYQSSPSIPKKAIEIGIKYFNIKRHYLVSLVGNKGHLANVYILIRNDKELQDKKTIESFIFKSALIFERILLENKEKEIKKRLEQVAEQAKSIIWEIDVSGEITYISPYVEKLLGYLPSELINSRSWSSIHSDEEKEIFANKLKQSIVNKASFNDVFTELQTISGDVLYVSSSGVPIIENREVVGFRGSDYDISTLKNIDKAKNEFINTVSHEMRTPLTVIKEASGIFGLGDLSEEQKEVLNISNKNINRLSRIINDVLDYQKLQARKVELVYESIDLKILLDEIIGDHKPIAEKKGLILSSSFHTRSTRFITDSDKLYGVIGNLLNNAIKYTDKGSIKIVVKDKIFTGNITIQVIDTGVGIPKKELPKLFKAFSQTSGVNSRKTGSTGLGLVICKEIVELFGGKITVSSAVGIGSTFTIELPKNKVS